MQHKIQFKDKEVLVEDKTNPSEVLNATNSPVLFGCRTGICGTCLIKVIDGAKNLDPPDEDEMEVLELLAPEEKNVRLACQLKINGDIKIEYIGK